jgi:hypothetical protein
MKIKTLILTAALSFFATSSRADILYASVGGHVTVNGVIKDGVAVQLVPVAGATLPIDFPTPAPSVLSTLADPITGYNYDLTWGSGYGDGSIPGPAGSFTFLAFNGAWFTTIDADVKFSYPGYDPVVITAAQVRQAYNIAPPPGQGRYMAIVDATINANICVPSKCNLLMTIQTWLAHPELWPAQVTILGKTYTRDQLMTLVKTLIQNPTIAKLLNDCFTDYHRHQCPWHAVNP